MCGGKDSSPPPANRVGERGMTTSSGSTRASQRDRNGRTHRAGSTMVDQQEHDPSALGPVNSDVASVLGTGEHMKFTKEPHDIHVVRKIKSGIWSEVDVVCRIPEQRPSYARKRVSRNVIQVRVKETSIQTSDEDLFREEVKNMKHIVHHHCIKFEGGYTSPDFFAIIMSPVAQYNLAQYLGQKPPPPPNTTLLQFFGCLSSALCYIHSQELRHHNLKPENILVSEDTVYLTDFESSFEWSKLAGSTVITTESTSWDIKCKSVKWISPEAAQPRPKDTNEKSDIWSLGCIFLEIEAMMKGCSADLKNYIQDNNNKTIHNSPINYHDHPGLIFSWIQCQLSNSTCNDNTPFEWIKRMLDSNPTKRPTASELVELIGKKAPFFCDKCLRIDDKAPVAKAATSGSYQSNKAKGRGGQGNQHYKSTISGEPVEAQNGSTASRKENQNGHQRRVGTDTVAARQSRRPATRA